MTWQTFWLEPTGRQRVALRRWHSPDGTHPWTCEAGWHEAHAWTGEEVDEVRNERGFIDSLPAQAHDDPRWPAECGKGCGYRFTEADAWQAWGGELWRRTDTGGLRVLHSTLVPPDVLTAEPGASWDAAWMGDPYRGPDGVCLMVRCPAPGRETSMGNDWLVDGPSSTGGRWTRTGDPRACNVTANPSIACGNAGEPGYYHGFLTSGVLTDSLP